MDLIDKKVEALEAFIEWKEQLKNAAPLRYLNWEPTLRCNMQCLHCGSDCVRDDSTVHYVSKRFSMVFFTIPLAR